MPVSGKGFLPEGIAFLPDAYNQTNFFVGKATKRRKP
jgi:hypothetical protein